MLFLSPPSLSKANFYFVFAKSLKGLTIKRGTQTTREPPAKWLFAKTKKRNISAKNPSPFKNVCKSYYKTHFFKKCFCTMTCCKLHVWQYVYTKPWDFIEWKIQLLSTIVFANARDQKNNRDLFVHINYLCGFLENQNLLFNILYVMWNKKAQHFN